MPAEELSRAFSINSYDNTLHIYIYSEHATYILYNIFSSLSISTIGFSSLSLMKIYHYCYDYDVFSRMHSMTGFHDVGASSKIRPRDESKLCNILETVYY